MNTQIDHVNKSYGQGESRSRVLKKISLTIEEGSICCLLGPSGSGKSTLLNILGGIDRADSGRVQVGNIRVDALTARQQIDYRRTHVGFIFQFY
ncbi:MAG TPA: ATP-binding cassette domain-containing protein, partial [Bacillota bacterium]|nr:ATP-binding cassette domain-containing protein [Bacillota bacterium]